MTVDTKQQEIKCYTHPASGRFYKVRVLKRDAGDVKVALYHDHTFDLGQYVTYVNPETQRSWKARVVNPVVFDHDRVPHYKVQIVNASIEAAVNAGQITNPTVPATCLTPLSIPNDDELQPTFWTYAESLSDWYDTDLGYLVIATLDDGRQITATVVARSTEMTKVDFGAAAEPVRSSANLKIGYALVADRYMWIPNSNIAPLRTFHLLDKLHHVVEGTQYPVLVRAINGMEWGRQRLWIEYTADMPPGILRDRRALSHACINSNEVREYTEAPPKLKDDTIDYVGLIQQLEELLPQVRRGELRYGTRGTHGSDALVIRQVATAGGLQWQLRNVNMFGQEHASAYYPILPNRSEFIRMILERVQVHHRPLPNKAIQAFLDKKRAERGPVEPLGFYLID